MSISTVAVPQREWEDLAHLDPLWAILTVKEKQFGKWDREEFFISGQAEIDTLMRSCGFGRGNNGKALDFGCGVGRLSRALRSYFEEVYGVDISEEMVRLAKEFTPGCIFLLNQVDNLNLFQDDSFDFIYSNIVLQHQPTQEVANAYIREFVRVVKPNGMVVFQIPYKLSMRYALQPRRRLYSLLRTCGFSANFIYTKLHLSPMRTICLPSEVVRATVCAEKGRVVQSYSDNFNHFSMTYVVTKHSEISP